MSIRTISIAAVMTGAVICAGCNGDGNGDTRTDRSTTRSEPGQTVQQNEPTVVPTGTRQSQRAALGDPDRFFLVLAAQINQAEIAAGRLATEQGSDPEVRQYGQTMIADHTQANESLKRLADRKGISLPDQPDETHQRIADHLSQLDGQVFDREFIIAMTADHAAALSLMQDKARLSQDPDVQAWAQEQKAMFQRHLRRAQEISRGFEAGAEESPDQSLRPRPGSSS